MTTGDPELDELLAGAPELVDAARRLRSSRPEPELDPRFRIQLRAQLMAEAASHLAPPRRPRWRLATGLAWGSAAVAIGVAAAVIVGAAVSRPHDQVTFVTASSPLAEQHAVTGDVITVAFNQPMDRSAVIRGLRIRPATAVRTSWKGDQLLIAPIHHLAPNTPYTVTIDEGAARASSGRVVRGGVRIAFGTAPVPTPPSGPAPSQPPTLDLQRLGPLAGPGALLIGQGGAVVATQAITPEPAAPLSTPAPASPAASPGLAAPGPLEIVPPTPGSTATSPPSPAPAVTLSPLGPALAVLRPAGATLRLGDAASTMALAPDGAHIAAAVPHGDGSDIAVGQIGAAGLGVIAHTAGPVGSVAWRPDGQVLVSAPGQVVTAAADGTLRAVLPTAPGAAVVLDPDGRHAAVGSRLIDLDTGAARDLHDAQGPVTFSRSGSAVAWFDGAAVNLSSVDTDQPTRVALPDACAPPPGELAVTDDRSRLACTSAGGALVLVDAATGRPLAATTGASHPAFSAAGDRLSLVVAGGVAGTFSAAVAAVPAAQAGPAAPTVPSAATMLLERLVDAQVRDDRAELAGISADQQLLSGTPAGLTRGRVVETASRADGVTALIRLMTDPSSDHPGRATDETVSLVPGGPAGFTVSSVAIGPVHDESSGPHVVHVDAGAGGAAVVGFDSDLAAPTVTGAVSVVAAGGSPVAAMVRYDADSRTAIITLPASASGPLRVVIGTTLTDIAGQPLGQAFSAPIR